MLPKLYTLTVTAIAGYLSLCSPDIYCSKCRRQIRYFEELELSLDVWPKCDLITERTDDQLFVSENLLVEFESINAKGYLHRPVPIRLSDDFKLQYSEISEGHDEILNYHYLMITGQCDGPWQYQTKGDLCIVCGQFNPAQSLWAPTIPHDEIVSSIARGDLSYLRPVFVFPETWHGEDIFYLAEMHTLVITERLAALLEKTGNLRQEEVKNQEKIRRTMPKYAAELDRVNWKKPACCVLGPADWVRSS